MEIAKPVVIPTTESAIIVQPPATVFQTVIDEDGKQDSSTPLLVKVRLSTTFMETCTNPLSKDFYGAIRNFDGSDIAAYSASTNTMQPLQLDPHTMTFYVIGDILTVKVYRKYLPVSKSYGKAPFVFSFLLKPSSEVLTTTPFFVNSKTTTATIKTPPKRVRKPPAVPFAGPHPVEGRVISNYLAGTPLSTCALPITDRVNDRPNDRVNKVECATPCRRKRAHDEISCDSSIQEPLIDSSEIDLSWNVVPLKFDDDDEFFKNFDYNPVLRVLSSSI